MSDRIVVSRQMDIRRGGTYSNTAAPIWTVEVVNKAGVSLSRGDVVVWDKTSNTTADIIAVTRTATRYNVDVLGMVYDTSIADGAIGHVQVWGPTNALKVNGTDNIAIGDYLATYSVNGIAGYTARAGFFARALEAYAADDSSGVIDAFIQCMLAPMPAGSVTTFADGEILALGTDSDVALVERATILGANTALTGVIVVATAAVTPAVSANSLILSNVTADGDIMVATQTGGNSAAWLWIDTSANLMTEFAVGVSSAEHGVSGVVFNEGSADRDFRIESNGNANMFVVDGGSDVVGIGGAVVAGNVLTVTGTAIAATGRITKLSATYAAAALTDGYGAFEVDVTLSGSPTNHSAAASAWVNITGGTVPPGTYICARNDGIYEEAAATVTNAKLVFGARMQYICTDTDGLRFPWSINTNNAAITALIDVNNLSDLGVAANAGATRAQVLPIARDAAGTKYYVLLYDLA